MHVEGINIPASDELGPVSSVRAVAGHGLEGDRYFFAGDKVLEELGPGPA